MTVGIEAQRDLPAEKTGSGVCSITLSVIYQDDG